MNAFNRTCKVLKLAILVEDDRAGAGFNRTREVLKAASCPLDYVDAFGALIVPVRC